MAYIQTLERPLVCAKNCNSIIDAMFFFLYLLITVFALRYIGEHLSDAEADSREDDSYLFDLDNKVSRDCLSCQQ